MNATEQLFMAGCMIKEAAFMGPCFSTMALRDSEHAAIQAMAARNGLTHARYLSDLAKQADKLGISVVEHWRNISKNGVGNVIRRQ